MPQQLDTADAGPRPSRRLPWRGRTFSTNRRWTSLNWWPAPAARATAPEDLGLPLAAQATQLVCHPPDARTIASHRCPAGRPKNRIHSSGWVPAGSYGALRTDSPTPGWFPPGRPLPGAASAATNPTHDTKPPPTPNPPSASIPRPKPCASSPASDPAAKTASHIRAAKHPSREYKVASLGRKCFHQPSLRVIKLLCRHLEIRNLRPEHALPPLGWR